jgi:hypothetical protein
LTGLAREVERMRRRVDDLESLGDEVRGLGASVLRLGQSLTPDDAVPGITSWLELPLSEEGRVEQATAILRDLVSWTDLVYLQFGDGAQALPDCWLWHPDVVEELLWLRRAWDGAYHGTSASVLHAGDWHDRARPNVTRRVRAAAGTCSIERHRHADRPVGSGDNDAPKAVARWWAESRRHDLATGPASRLGRGEA